jgi:hypothetical protein
MDGQVQQYSSDIPKGKNILFKKELVLITLGIMYRRIAENKQNLSNFSLMKNLVAS